MGVIDLRYELKNVAAGHKFAGQLAIELGKSSTEFGELAYSLDMQTMQVANLLTVAITNLAITNDASQIQDAHAELMKEFRQVLSRWIVAHTAEAPDAAKQWLLNIYKMKMDEATAAYNMLAGNVQPAKVVQRYDKGERKSPGPRVTFIIPFDEGVKQIPQDKLLLMKQVTCKRCRLPGFASVRYADGHTADKGGMKRRLYYGTAHPSNNPTIRDIWHVHRTLTPDEAVSLAKELNQTRISSGSAVQHKITEAGANPQLPVKEGFPFYEVAAETREMPADDDEIGQASQEADRRFNEALRVEREMDDNR